MGLSCGAKPGFYPQIEDFSKCGPNIGTPQAQRAFEREDFEGTRQRAGTDDFLAAIGETRPTLTAEIVTSFEEETRRFARF